ncbi:MAG: T9SS type A sorting domain-containing protein, partial [Bacteroidota bacterium]
SINGFDRLNFVNRGLVIENHPVLTELNGFENLLSIEGPLTIDENPQLSDCTAFCNLLRNGQVSGLFLQENAPGCNGLIDGCSEVLVKGQVYFDFNANGQRDPNEPTSNNPLFGLDIQPSFLQSLALQEGRYQLSLDPGSYTISTKEESPFRLLMPLSLNVTNEDTCLIQDIGLTPKEEVKAAEMFVSFPDRMRCNSNVRVRVKVINTGNATLSGKVALVLDERTSLTSAATPPDEIIGDSLVWQLDDLFPTFDTTFQIIVAAPSEQFTGKLLSFRTTAFDESQNTLWSNTQVEEVRCSYDPNDKATNPLNETLANYTPFGEDLLYIIRFENTGNDTAFLVRISDLLDKDLDWSTFKFIQASHPLTSYALTKEGMVVFTFEDINLLATKQDSTQSMGFVQYAIAHKENLPENTRIENSASIFFDANPPILTNTVLNTLVSEIPTSAREITDELGIRLYPNPFRQAITLDTEEDYQALQLRVFNLQGQLVVEREIALSGRQQRIDLPELGAGLFIFQFREMASGRTGSFRVFGVAE